MKAKRLITILLALTLALGLLPATALAAGYWVGDVNGDGNVNADDVTLLSRHVKGWSGCSIANTDAADLNRDGKVTINATINGQTVSSTILQGNQNYAAMVRSFTCEGQEIDQVAISSVTATATTGKITLKWTAASGAKQYLVQKQVSGTETWTTLTPVSTTAYTDAAVTAGTKYAYRVRPKNDAGYAAFKACSAVTAK